MTRDTVQELIAKTMAELKAAEKPTQNSRTWKSPEGYRYLVQWTNSVLLRYLVRLLTNSLPKSEYRRKSQLDDCTRSVVRNVEEGYKRANTSDYLNFIGYSQGSLEETKGDIRELCEDGFLASKPGSSLDSIGINLQDIHQALGPKGTLKDDKGNYINTYIPLIVLYPPLKNLQAKDLSYELFLELIQKTDYLLRLLVESLEKKLYDERQGYKINQARIQEKFKKR